jgi:Tat protein secretion system quality control protein TatD with DNase activity
VAEKVAELKEITVEEVLETTFANVQRLFGLSEKKL